MSKVAKVLSPVAAILGLGGSKPPPINIPEPKVPAAPAPIRRSDTGASVAVGTSSNIKNQRVSGRSFGNNSVRNILGGLGRGGLNI